MNEQKLIAVTGATGRQGGAVAEYLLKAGFRVRALTRNPASVRAERLARTGAEIAAADMEDRAALERALEGADGVFSVQNYWEKGVGYEGEIRQGRNLADAARKADVGHIVQASIADAEKAPGVKHWECKVEIESYIDEIGLRRISLGGTFFMENFLDPKFGPMMFPFLSGSLKPQTRFHMVSVDDVGGIAAVVFQDPQRFIGKRINIAGDLLTVGQMKEVYREVTGRKPKQYPFPAWLARLVNREMADQLAWNNDPGWRFSLEEVKDVYPALTSFEQFMRQHPETKL